MVRTEFGGAEGGGGQPADLDASGFGPAVVGGIEDGGFPSSEN